MSNIVCERDIHDNCKCKGVCTIFGKPDDKCITESMNETVVCMYCKKEVKRKETIGDSYDDNGLCCKDCH